MHPPRAMLPSTSASCISLLGNPYRISSGFEAVHDGHAMSSGLSNRVMVVLPAKVNNPQAKSDLGHETQIPARSNPAETNTREWIRPMATANAQFPITNAAIAAMYIVTPPTPMSATLRKK